MFSFDSEFGRLSAQVAQAVALVSVQKAAHLIAARKQTDQKVPEPSRFLKGTPSVVVELASNSPPLCF